MKITNFWNLLDTSGEIKKLPYLHGVEMEYFILDDNYKPITKNEKLISLVEHFYDIIQGKIKSDSKFKKKINSLDLCNKSKLREREHSDDIKKVQTVSIEYRQPNYNYKPQPIDIIGKDTNIGTGGFITLELVTPPCSSIEELRWWIKSIFNSTLEGCKKLRIKFLPIASHPKIKKNFCGEHHHIGIKNMKDRIKVYNTMRLFIPLISILTFTSFDKQIHRSMDNINKEFIETKFPNCIRSLRLNQTSQIQPIPPIFKNHDIESFAKDVGLNVDTCRMVDLYPFSKYGTIEVRMFDTQISIARSVSTAIILQSICQYALDLDDDILNIINKIVSKRVYEILRHEYIKNGLESRQNFNYSFLNKELGYICKLC
ncbi:MAG: hypothetical protein EU549_04255, partial [Promethearchaeota archaeon]